MNRALTKRGFTLVELILVIGMIAIIGVATVGMLHDSHAVWRMTSRRSTLLQDSQAAMEQMLRILRQAKSFDTISDSTEPAGSVVFTDVDNITMQFSRDAVDNELDYGEPGDLNALAGALSSLVFTCYDIDGAALSDPVDVDEIQSVEVNATFTDPDDSSISFTLSGRVFCATDPTALIARWALNEASGFTAADIAGGYDGTLTNMNGNEWAGGVLGGALEFDGSNDYVSASSIAVPTTAFTFALWFKPDADWSSASGEERFIEWTDGVDTSRPYWTFNKNGNDDGKIGLHVKIDDVSYGDIKTTTSSWSSATWHHLAVTWDGTDFKVYVNGVQEGPAVTHSGTHFANSGLQIGQREEGTWHFGGLLDDVRIYNTALSAEEVAVLANVLRYREFTEAKTGSDTTSITISTPGGASEGDLLIAAVATDGDTSTTLDPPDGEGWTVIDINDYSSAVTLGVWWKNADASESATHQFTWSEGNQSAYGWMMRFTGHDPSTPINDWAADGATSSTPTSPAVSPTVDYALIVRLGAFDDGDITQDSPGLSGHEPITMDSAGSSTVTLESTTISKETGGSSNFVVSMPATRPDDDLYIAQIAQEGGATISSIPGGWTEITNSDRSGSIRMATYRKIGSSEPATYTWGADSSKKWLGAIHRISGINTSSPIDASKEGTGNGSSPTAPSVTTRVDNCLVLRMYGAEGDEQASTYWPDGTTAIFQDDEGGGTVVGAAAYEYEASAGSTGTGAFSMTGSKKWVAATVAIAPGDGADGVSGGAGWLSQTSSGSTGTSTFSLTASQEAQLLTIAIKPDPDGGSR